MKHLQTFSHSLEYMRASQAVITKPGGLSSTEAAVCGAPLIHISPIPGCESRNAAFFSGHGLSLHIGRQMNCLSPALNYLQKGSHADRMVQMQQKEINGHAAEAVCDFKRQGFCYEPLPLLLTGDSALSGFSRSSVYQMTSMRFALIPVADTCQMWHQNIRFLHHIPVADGRTGSSPKLTQSGHYGK
ncbi:MAG: hypothetical protein LUH19_08885 [Lachnospiraceae bacterium]|nr:hypothetical protein [Lachnospiraceae bacterium]